MRLALMLVAITACWRDAKPAPPAPPPAAKPAYTPSSSAPTLTDMERLLQAMEGFADALCACTDSSCVQRVSEEMTRWSQEQTNNHAEPPKMTDEEIRRATELGERMGRCMQNAMSGSAAPPPPTP